MPRVKSAIKRTQPCVFHALRGTFLTVRIKVAQNAELMDARNVKKPMFAHRVQLDSRFQWKKARARHVMSSIASSAQVRMCAHSVETYRL